MRDSPDGDVLIVGSSADMGDPVISDSSPSSSARSGSIPSTGGFRFPITSVLLAVAVIVLDQITKAWAVDRLDAGSCAADDACIDVFWKLRFHLAFNPGASFSSFAGGGKVLGLIAVVMAAYLFYLAARTSDRVLVVLFGIVAGGALGNLADRVSRADDGPLSGEVVDFIDFQFWPIFNVADVAVVCGVIAVAFRLWRNDQEADADLEVESP